jgi:CBS domain-containing protein
MKVSNIMMREPAHCGLDDTLNHAAQLMWENDCGCIPIVDADHRPVGMITDRDICMAAYTQGKLLSDIPVCWVTSEGAVTVRDEESLEVAEALMRSQQIRRLPVVDSQDRLIGLLSIGDLVRHAHPKQQRGSGVDPDSIVRTLIAIGQPRDQPMAAE